MDKPDLHGSPSHRTLDLSLIFSRGTLTARSEVFDAGITAHGNPPRILGEPAISRESKTDCT